MQAGYRRSGTTRSDPARIDGGCAARDHVGPRQRRPWFLTFAMHEIDRLVVHGQMRSQSAGHCHSRISPDSTNPGAFRLCGQSAVTWKEARSPRSVIMPLTCTYSVAGAGFEPATSGL